MKEEILKLAQTTLTPIGWYGEKAKSIEGIEEFVNKLLTLLEKEKQHIEE